MMSTKSIEEFVQHAKLRLLKAIGPQVNFTAVTGDSTNQADLILSKSTYDLLQNRESSFHAASLVDFISSFQDQYGTVRGSCLTQRLTLSLSNISSSFLNIITSIGFIQCL
jgi:hypothetical protein